jgi:phosphoserine aminotransferase
MQFMYLTPGPSHPHQRLREFLDDAWEQDIMAVSHRGVAFSDTYRRTDRALRGLMGIPDDYVIMFVGSATEVMERIIQGVVADRSHHLINGAFAEKWFKIAEQLGKHPTAVHAAPGQPFKPADLAVPVDVELLCITHNETSTGSIIPDAVLDRLTRAEHRPLVAIDVVSSAPMTPLPWRSLDLVFFSVQKAFGLPAGLGVLIASPRALQKSEALKAKGIHVGSYHSLPTLAASAAKFQTPATPNVLGIYLLGRTAEDMLERGIENLRAENRARAARLYEAIAAHEHMRPFVSDEQWRSPTVIVADVRQGSTRLRQHMNDQGLILGKGYQDFADQHVRIANFPALDGDVFDTLVAGLQHYSS